MSFVLGFAGSNSSTSINYQLTRYTISLVRSSETRLLDMADHSFPMYSQDYEKEYGFSDTLIGFNKDIQNAKGIILSVNEHNSNPSAYFKNVIDWLSRMERKFIEGKKVLLMSTSPGKRGGKSALEITEKMLSRFGATITGTFSLSAFYDNFDVNKGILDPDLAKEHARVLNNFLDTIHD
ncbi:NADPH-dependent FMN reductase [Maribacter sp. 2304DJ31-5]|uniref:NADPH-dependent FMN reductase n=1 Tax=Maribacter sp. 2304DJ31-5 TaxID=3386273 RepID=UPI0039BCC828